MNAKDTNTQASVKNGSGITVTPSTNANGTANYTVAVNVDGSTITVNNDGKLVANVPDTSKVSLTNNAGKVGDVSAEDANKLVTGDNLAKTINATYWKASQGTHEETTSEETTGAVSSEIKPGDELTFVSGKNMALKKDGNKFVYATKDDVTFNNVTTNNFTVNAKGNVDMGGNQVHNVSTGTAPTDAVNVKQLYDTVSGNVSTESVIKKADEDNIAEVTVADNKQSGDKNAKYEVSVSKAKIKALANETVKVNTSTAANNPITVTPHTENGNTTYSVNFNGENASKVIPLSYKANDGEAKTVTLSEGLNFKNGTQTTAEVAANGVVKFNVNTTALSNVTNNGKITVPEGNGLVTAKEVAEAINASYWKANAGGNVDGATVADNVTTGTEVFFAAGKNLKVKHSANNFTFSTADDVSFNNVTTNNLTVNAKGNVDMGGNQVHNVANGTKGTDAVNLDQLNATTAIANAGWVIKANGTNATTVKPNATVSLNNTDGNILITKNTANNNVTFNFNPNATFGVVGKDGKDGVDGSIGVNSKNGSSVVIKDGSIGLNGKDGKNGLSIKGDQGPAGVDGKDGETKTRIVYEYADPQDPNKTIRENVATLNDGLIFTGNNGIRNNHKLNTLVTIIGEGVDKAASANFTSASGNINVKADGEGTLEVQLAKNLKNIETINNGNSTITLNKDGGTTISGGDVSVDGNKVTNVKDGEISQTSKDAVNGSQLYNVTNNITTKGLDFGTQSVDVNGKQVVIHKDLGAKLDIVGEGTKADAEYDASNIKTIVKDGKVVVALDKNLKTETITVTGKDGKDGKIGINGKGGTNGKDGTTRVDIQVEKGVDGVDGKNGKDGISRIVYEDKGGKHTVATLEDGLKFKGDSEQVINRTLGSQMNITGGADSTKLTDNNIGVVYDEATNGLKVKLSKDVDLGKDGSITIGGTQVTNNGLTIKNGPSVTEKGVDAGNKKVTNVADGDINATSKDAVNGSQLYQAVNNINKNVNAAKTELEEGDNVTITSRVGNNGQTIYKVSSTDNSAHVQGGSDAVSVTKAETTRKDGSTTVTDYTVDLSSKTKDDIKKGVDAHDTVTNKGLTFNADKGTTGAKKLGSQVAVNGDNKNIETVADTNGVKVKLKDDINVNSVTANTFKAGDTIVNTKGVQVAAKDDRGNNTNVVINEKGINAGNTRIQNVAAGRADTDAVNVSQLKGAVTQIGNHINKMDKNLRAGIAGAMAAGGLYHATLPGKSMVAAGAGTYKGESAVAVGYSRLSDNGKVGIKFSVNTNTRGDSGAAASVGYQW